MWEEVFTPAVSHDAVAGRVSLGPTSALQTESLHYGFLAGLTIGSSGHTLTEVFNGMKT